MNRTIICISIPIHPYIYINICFNYRNTQLILQEETAIKQVRKYPDFIVLLIHLFIALSNPLLLYTALISFYIFSSNFILLFAAI